MSTRFFNLDDSYNEMVEAWAKGLPKNFGFYRKIKNLIRKMLSFVGYLFVWVGAWDYIDVQFIEEDISRDALYLSLPIIISFIFEELLSQESLYYMAAHSKNCCSCCKNAYCFNFCTPGHSLYPTQDYFARVYIQPHVEQKISPFQDWVICIYNYFNVIIIVMIIQLFASVGMWDLFSYYVWPYNETSYRDLTYCVVGFITMFLSLVFFSTDESQKDMEDSWHNGLPKRFGIKRKVTNYAKEMLSFLGFLFVWIGAWDFIDTKIWEGTVLRDIFYFIIPWFISFTLEELLSSESVYYMAIKFKKWRDKN